MQPFIPFFRNPHLATIAGNFWLRDLDLQTFPVEEKLYPTDPGVQVLVHSQRPERPVAQLILVHGLEGSSDAGYARSLAHAALARGFAVHRFNMRSCGGTEHLSGKTLYHSGQTSDLLTVIMRLKGPEPFFLAGFSLGGNVALKLAGELSAAGSDLLTGVVAVSTPIDLAACATKLGHPSNIIYARRFLGRLKERVRAKERLNPGSFRLEALPRVRTIYDFDDQFTAPSFGFGTADNYYATQSSNQYLGRIRIPALVVQAKDDPMIPFSVFRHPAFEENPCLRLVTTDHGGHLGFISRSRPRFWLDHVILEWLEEVRNKTAPGLVLKS